MRLLEESLLKGDTAATTQSWGEEWFGSEHVERRFVALLKCDNVRCSEVAAVAGRGDIEEQPDDFLEQVDYVDQFYPTYFSPSPLLIRMPPDTPTLVVDELARAFASSWSDSSAAGNHIRTAAERLLDALRVRKTSAKRSRLTLHVRLEMIKAARPALWRSLTAIKWLGNAGSHSGSLTREDVFDALDILESVLEDLYSKHPKNLERLVATVNRRKGPRPRRG